MLFWAYENHFTFHVAILNTGSGKKIAWQYHVEVHTLLLNIEEKSKYVILDTAIIYITQPVVGNPFNFGSYYIVWMSLIINLKPLYGL